MPLRAISGNQNVNAFDCTDVEWREIKENYRSMDLRMPCCDSAAIPKTSKLNNFFFSHARRGECTTAPESAEHIFLKTVIAKSAVRAGWSVFTEWSGETPSGAKWTADVFCEKGNAKIALEVQLSYQTVQELLVRQDLYKQSGIRAAWFVSSTKFKEGYFNPSKSVPFFYLLPFELGQEPSLKGFDVALSEFVMALLSKRVTWESKPWVYLIHYLNDTCWKCGGRVKQVFGSSTDVYGESAKTVPNMSTVLKKLGEIISNDQLKSLGLNTVGRFDRLKGNAPGYPYCNQCILCGAPQNNFYVMKKLGAVIVLDDKFESDSPEIGSQEFVSLRESSGFWQYKK